jgi:predicted permease
VSVFLLLFAGYGAKKIGILRPQDAGVMNTVVVYIMMPAFIFLAIYHQPHDASVAKVPVVGFMVILAVLGLTYAIGRLMKLDRATLGGMIIAAGFGNTGFLGYPVVQAAFHGKSGALVTAALYDNLAMSLPLNILGVMIIAAFAGERVEKKRFLKVLTLPALWAIPIALWIPINVPQPVMVAIERIAGGTVPLVMISIGLSISSRSLKGLAVPTLVTSLLKIAVLPALTFFAAKAFGLIGVTHNVTVLEAGMPTAAMSCVIAAEFGGNERFVVGVLFLTTLLSIVTIPLILLILGVNA